MIEQPKEGDILDQRIKGVLEGIQSALRSKEEDPEQNTLIEAIQAHRSVILDIASNAYMHRPNDPKLLEALSSLIGQLEKSVRDDRKERQKKQDSEDNKVAFRQMVEALGSLASGDIQLPTFSGVGIFMDPLGNKEGESQTFADIKPGELTGGIIGLDFDGNSVK